MHNNSESFKAGECACRSGWSIEAPSVYNQEYFAKGYNSVVKSHRVTDFKSVAFIGSFSECCNYIKGKDYLKGYVIASYNL